ncbi:MAG: hypothetical protein GY834_15040 [Bacteroidetes bacterium]|nr:hypothetical protein [Bacteroidota bacterium]
MSDKFTKQAKQSFFFILFLALIISSCKKDRMISIDENIKLEFSSDSISFDTVFTTIGSVTKQLKILNPSDQKIKISSIKLNGGELSRYRINIDGVPALEVHDIELNAHDSLYIFIKVMIDPNDENSPFVVADQIQFMTNGNTQNVELVAWGQNANYVIADQIITGLPPFKIIAEENTNTTWDANKPYLVYGYAVVDSGASLLIKEGTQIHFHNNSGLWIYKGGNIKVDGTKENPVVFQGDRLDFDYQDIPGQWDRIWINEGSIDNEINYAIIKNGFIGIQAETLEEQMGNSLILTNTEITNMTGSGILSRNYNINGFNNVISNSENYLLALTMGGIIDFNHCTFANYWSRSVRQLPSVYISNYHQYKSGSVSTRELHVNFGNSIIDGVNNEELEIDLLDDDISSFLFDHTALKTLLDTDNSFYLNCLINKYNFFKHPTKNSFELGLLSPAINRGSIDIGIMFPIDLSGNSRIESPDLGAYEFAPENSILQKNK